MSRTTRRDRNSYQKTVRDGKGWYKCRCNWCINIPWRDRDGLSVDDDLNLD
jgi:hypothetical protein